MPGEARSESNLFGKTKKTTPVQQQGITVTVKMAKLLTCFFLITSLLLWYVLLFGGKGGSILGFTGATATNGHGTGAEGRDRHYHERGGHIKRDLNHCWRRYDGYNLQNTYVNKKEKLMKPYGILCKFQCTWFFTISFPTCDFIYDYKLSCHLFTSLPDCTSVKCTLLTFFN